LIVTLTPPAVLAERALAAAGKAKKAMNMKRMAMTDRQMSVPENQRKRRRRSCCVSRSNSCWSSLVAATSVTGDLSIPAISVPQTEQNS
jgi:hypothetical protein